ncbi:MAG: Ig-like domain-containing protein, partial [Shewanella sp.]
VTFAGQTASTLITVSAATLESISLTPTIAEVPAGTTQQYQLFGVFSDGSNHDLSAFAHYQTSDSTLVTIDSNGLASAHQYNVKPVTVTASYNGLQAKATLKVTAGLLDHIEVTPATQNIAIGHKGELQARAFYSDNTSADITALATWSVNDGNVASVDNTQANSGAVLGISQGVVTVTANFGGKTASNTTTVTAAVLESVTISPVQATLVAGLVQQYGLTAQFSDNSSIDVTKLSAWQSSDVAIAAIDNSGLAHAYKEGSVSITASYQGQSASANLSVLAVTLTELKITPENPNEPVGSQGQFSATGYFSNGLTANVTRGATWSSSDSSVVSIVASGTKAGQASADKVGTSTISASFGGVSDTSLATVTQAELVSIVITPGIASVMQGMQYQFKATGIYSDNVSKNITNAVNWQTSDASVASITSQGLAKGENKGTTEITAKYQGKQARATLVVAVPVIIRLDVIPTFTELPIGSSMYYQAIAYDATGQDYDVSKAADWRMVNQTIAHVDNTVANGGYVTALSKGTTQIVVSFAGKSQTVSVQVTPAEVTSLIITPSDITILDGETQFYVATAQFSDGSSLVVTKESSWVSTNPEIATITTNGSAIAAAKYHGVTNIQATYQGITAQTSLTVQEREIKGVQVIPHVKYLDVGEQLQMKCMVDYVDYSVNDCTDEALWTIGDDTIAHVEPEGGLVTAIKSGHTRVFATYKGVSSKTDDGQVSVR